MHDKQISRRPGGAGTLAAATGDEDVTIEDVIEPFLIQLGFIARTPRGRVALPAAYGHLAYRMKRKSKECIYIAKA